MLLVSASPLQKAVVLRQKAVVLRQKAVVLRQKAAVLLFSAVSLILKQAVHLMELPDSH